MNLSDLTIKSLKSIVPRHELSALLHRWFKKSHDEISEILSNHGFDHQDIHADLVKLGLHKADVINDKVVQALKERLEKKGLTEKEVNKRLLNAGMTKNEIGTEELKTPNGSERKSVQNKKILHFPSKT